MVKEVYEVRKEEDSEEGTLPEGLSIQLGRDSSVRKVWGLRKGKKEGKGGTSAGDK